jgi:hypothetical protein
LHIKLEDLGERSLIKRSYILNCTNPWKKQHYFSVALSVDEENPPSVKWNLLILLFTLRTLRRAAFWEDAGGSAT